MKFPCSLERFVRSLLGGLLCWSFAAEAQLAIEITGAGMNQIPVAIANFGGDAKDGQSLTAVVRSDLERSGLFRLVDASGEAINETSAVDYGLWKIRGADALAAGSLRRNADGRLEARFRLYDVNRQENLGGAAYLAATAQLRAAGHRVADYIYEKLTGEKGVFSTRIAYVHKTGGRYELRIADSDGQNAQTALVSREPIISPAWSPDGARIAYVSFENKKPIIFVHSLSTGARQVVANFKGSNSAPAWSPDGQRLAIVLTRDGNSQIYLIGANGGAPTRLTTSAGIDTEPQFSADGAQIYFTSDRGGSPQIYRVAASGGAAERVTFEGSYNVSPHPSPDGKNMAFITRRDGRFQLAVMDLQSRQVQVLSDFGRDESPSFAPNGRMIVLATEANGRGVLSAVSTDGSIRQRLSVPVGDVREPAWGPFLR
ncbi:MAG: Tol-Pal system beta propeller repeat protein TolB [Zoogloeaceae bacterium]|jgi:TolB protein|nr:Tol-Pal system beta propeller repeat protein TolB [Zoogloeaceae bacterium]